MHVDNESSIENYYILSLVNYCLHESGRLFDDTRLVVSDTESTEVKIHFTPLKTTQVWNDQEIDYEIRFSIPLRVFSKRAFKVRYSRLHTLAKSYTFETWEDAFILGLSYKIALMRENTIRRITTKRSHHWYNATKFALAKLLEFQRQRKTGSTEWKQMPLTFEFMGTPKARMDNSGIQVEGPKFVSVADTDLLVWKDGVTPRVCAKIESPARRKAESKAFGSVQTKGASIFILHSGLHLSLEEAEELAAFLNTAVKKIRETKS